MLEPSGRWACVYMFMWSGLSSVLSPRPDTSCTNARVLSQSHPKAPGNTHSRPSIQLLSKPSGTPPAPIARGLVSCPPMATGSQDGPSNPSSPPGELGQARSQPAGLGQVGWTVRDRQAQRKELSVHSPTPLPAPLQGQRLAQGAWRWGVHREQVSLAVESVSACLAPTTTQGQDPFTPLCPHSLCDLTQQPALGLLTRAAGAGMDDSKVPSTSELPSPAWAAPSATHPRPVDTRASVGRNRNPRHTKREGRCGGHGRDRRDDKCIQCPRQHHQPLQVHTRKFMAPSPGPGDLSPACHSWAFFILRPPCVCITRHPPGHLRGLPASCRDIQTP